MLPWPTPTLVVSSGHEFQYGDVTVVHLSNCAVLVSNKEYSWVEVHHYIEADHITLSATTRF